MSSNKALTTQQSQALAMPQNPVTALFKQFDPQRYNVIAPVTHMAELPIGTRLVVTEVRVSADTANKEVVAIAGGTLMLTKSSLDRVAGAAGISWLSEKRIDDGKHPHYVQMEVHGKITDFDGTVRECTGSKAIDLRADAGGGVPGKDYEEIVSKAQGARPPRDPGPQLMEARKFIAEIAASKARNRAIATVLGIKRSYTRDELQRPFIVPRLVMDPANPQAQQLILANMAGATAALFGSKPGMVIDAKLETAANNAGAVDEPEEAPAPRAATPSPSAVGDGLPPLEDDVDPETGEVAEDSPEAIKARLNAAWKQAQASGLDAKAWHTLVKTTSGKTKYEDLNAYDLKAIEMTLKARIANAGGAS